jgi:myosin heavy subunit
MCITRIKSICVIPASKTKFADEEPTKPHNFTPHPIIIVLHQVIVRVPADDKFLRGAARQLGFTSSSDLAKALTTQTVSAGRTSLSSKLKERARSSTKSSTMEASLSVAQARASRDALAKFLYGALFAWIVDRINGHMSQNSHGGSKQADRVTRTIGILDIFGFEVLDSMNNKANFEQLCINYANEMLQKQVSIFCVSMYVCIYIY